MEQQNTLYSYIYQNLKKRITSDHSFPGTQLPSARRLCEEYHAGIYTITRVLKALEKEGLIKTRPRQAPVILVLQKKNSETPEIITILEQRNSILQIFKTCELLLPPLFAFASRNCSLEMMPHYNQVMRVARKGVSRGVWRESSAFIKDILKSCGNPLLCDLYANLQLHENLSFFFEKCDFFKENFLKGSYAVTGQMIDIFRSNDSYKKYREIKKLYQKLYLAVSDTIQHLMSSVSNCPAPADIPFNWNPLRGKDYYYMRIVRDLIRKIGKGIFPVGTFLPFEAQLAKQYGVSVFTVRKALDLLERRGYTKTLNAKGTMVLLPDDSHVSMALSDLASKQDALLYLHALQLMVLLAHPIAECVVNRFQSEELEFLSDIFQKKDFIHLTALFQATAEHLELKPLRDIFIETSRVTEWGFYLCYYPRSSATITQLERLTFEAFRQLCDKNVLGFGEGLANCYRYILNSVRAYMLDKYNFNEGLSVRTPQI